MKRTKRRPSYLRDWRKLRGLSQEELADRVSMSQETISRLERGEIAYTQPVLEAVAGVLGCLPADLLKPPSPLQDKLSALIDGLDTNKKKRALRILEVAFAAEESEEGEGEKAA